MIYLDFETYSEIDLLKSGMHNYCTHPSTEILCMAFSLDGENVKIWTPENNLDLTELFDMVRSGSRVVAHNASFEMCVWQNIVVGKMFVYAPTIPINQWRCSAAKAAAMNLPRSLKEVSNILGCSELKDDDGAKVMLKLCKPVPVRRKAGDDSEPLKQKHSIEDNRELYDQLYDYCVQDVKTTIQVHKTLPDLTDYEQHLWELDQAINNYGVQIDVPLARKCNMLVHTLKHNIDVSVNYSTDGELLSINQTKALKEKFEYLGDYVPSLNKKELASVDTDDFHPVTKKLLALREAGSNTSLKKFEKFLDFADSRGILRHNYLYHGASTGRWTSLGVQLHNLPRGDGVKYDDENYKAISKYDYDQLLEYTKDKSNIWGFLSGCVRGMLRARQGKVLYCADYSAIEARVIAWLSDQFDLVDGFKNGRDVYKEQAAFTFNKNVEQINSDERSIGKVLVLACGFGMGAEKFSDSVKNATGKELELEFCQSAVRSYRSKNQNIVHQWKLQENAVRRCVMYREQVIAGKITWFMEGTFLTCTLPSGRFLRFKDPSIQKEQSPYGVRSNIMVSGVAKGQLFKHSFYGGIIVQNIVQAISRDIMANAIDALMSRGIQVVMHSHDEIVSELPSDTNITLDDYIDIICKLPLWASGIPISAQGWAGVRYRKD